MLEDLCPARRRRKFARPQELLDAALGLFVEKGFAATRTEEVAARAGVSKGTLYRYYPSKEELLRAVIAQRLSSEVAATALRAAAHHGTNADLLRDVLSTWWGELADGPAGGIFKLVLTEVRNFPEIAEFWNREVIEPGRHLIGRVVQRGMDDGEFRPIDPNAVAYSLLLPIIMACLHRRIIGACTPTQTLEDAPDFVRHHIDLVLQGLTPLTPPSRELRSSVSGSCGSPRHPNVSDRPDAP